MSQDYRRTVSYPDHECDKQVAALEAALWTAHEWVCVSDSYPVYMNGVPYYTVTITAGMLE